MSEETIVDETKLKKKLHQSSKEYEDYQNIKYFKMMAKKEKLYRSHSDSNEVDAMVSLEKPW